MYGWAIHANTILVEAECRAGTRPSKKGPCSAVTPSILLAASSRLRVVRLQPMKCTFTVERESSLVRRFTVRLEATPEKPISTVETRYDGLSLERDDLQAPVTTFERVYRKDQANSPGQHDLFVTAELSDGTSESFTRIWDE